MSLAERLSALDAGSLKPWLVKANRYGPGIVSAIIVLAIAYQLAQTTWRIVPGERVDVAPPVVAAGNSEGESYSVAEFDALRDAHPFGEAPEETVEQVPVSEVIDAPETTLNLELTGVVVRNPAESSRAMIVSGTGRNAEQTYVIGDTVANTNARLHEVHTDKAILFRAGRYESLPLRKYEDTPQLARARSANLAALPTSGNNSQSLQRAISENAARLTDIVRLAPHVEGGAVVGFRVNPGRMEDAFNVLGFQAGDVVTDINGIALNDASRGLQAFEALGESSTANVTILRDGTPQVIVVDTTQVQSLSEDRQ